MFVGYEPWVEQYFKNIETSDKNIVSCGDYDAWKRYPDFNWVYNKLELSRSQDIDAAPHGVVPSFEPIFSKPIMNLHGMGLEARKIFSWDDKEYRAGHFWMPVLSGCHLSVNMAVKEGLTMWTYPMHITYDEDDYKIKFEYIMDTTDHDKTLDKLRIWVKNNLEGFSGVINIEIIGDKMIECHLRMHTQFIDLFGGDEWLKQVDELYVSKFWDMEKKIRKVAGYSYIMRKNTGGNYIIEDKEKLEELKSRVSSIQLILSNVVKENVILDNYNRKIAVINGHDSDEIEKVMKELDEIIILTDKE